MKSEILNKAIKYIDELENELIEFRHNLHKIPEIGLKEYKTSQAIRNKLIKYNLTALPPFLETDVVALINPGKEKNVTIRADIDAIPQFEETDFPYKSTFEGMMHACGHDGHTAILTGTAIVLNMLKDELPGSVRLLFQPAEEGLRGAEFLCKTDVLKENKPSAVLALHNIPGFHAGSFIGKTGILTSSITPFKIKLVGKSVHSSIPEQGIDPIIIGTKIVNEFEKIVNDPSHLLYKSNLKICKFQSGTGGNIIPHEALLQGTARCFKSDQEKNTPEIIESIVSAICKGYGGQYELEITPAMHIVNNDPKLKAIAEVNVNELFGTGSWIEKDEPFKFSEDFSEFEKYAPTLMVGVGTGENKPALHAQNFEFNDNIIKKSILFWIKMTFDILYKETEK